jgi:polyhydroxyalkanoate synthase
VDTLAGRIVPELLADGSIRVDMGPPFLEPATVPTTLPLGPAGLPQGELELDGVKLDLGQVKTPVYVQSSKEDHIAPARSAYRGARLFGGPTTFTLSGSGHIAGVINAPVAKKYQHWTHDTLPESLEAWQAGAVETPGSWWPHWAEWLKSRSGAQVPARDPSAGPLPALEDAPGSYVKVTS